MPEKFIRNVQEKKLGNIVMMGRQPKEKVSALWSLCDFSTMRLKSKVLLSKVIPSKLFESFAMGFLLQLECPKLRQHTWRLNIRAALSLSPRMRGSSVG
mgnify:CR=1 FL=1